VRSTFTRHGGSLGESGCVNWLFETKGVITIKAENIDADELALTAIDAGAEDVKVQSDYVEVYTAPEQLEKVRLGLEQNNVQIESSELVKEPQTLIKLDEKSGLQAMKMLEKLEEIDDVQNVYSNADIPDSVMESYEAS
jgi:transcriptional/translational regulatory protein YebC/TACO1